MSGTNEVRIVNEQTGGMKGSKDEAFSLLPWEQLAEVARLYHFGSLKYSRSNWQKGYDWHLSYDSLMRHAAAWWEGDFDDDETGCDHMTSVVFHALALMFFRRYHPDLDDRPCTVLGQYSPGQTSAHDRLDQADEMLDAAWGLLANASGGDWDKEDPEWKAAAERWRDELFRQSDAIADKNTLAATATPEEPSEPQRATHERPGVVIGDIAVPSGPSKLVRAPLALPVQPHTSPCPICGAKVQSGCICTGRTHPPVGVDIVANQTLCGNMTCARSHYAGEGSCWIED